MTFSNNVLYQGLVVGGGVLLNNAAKIINLVEEHMFARSSHEDFIDLDQIGDIEGQFVSEVKKRH